MTPTAGAASRLPTAAHMHTALPATAARVWESA